MKKDGYHHGGLRQAMLQAAIEELAIHGEEGLNVRILAERVGVSTAAPYHHFGKRDALLGSVAEEGFVRALAELEARVDPDLDRLEATIAMGLGYVRFAVQNPSLFRLMFGHGLRFSDRHEGLGVAVGGFWEVLVGPVAELVAEGRLGRDGQGPEQVAFSMWAHAHGIASILANRDRWSLDGVDFDAAEEAWVEASLRALVDGLRPR